MRTAIIIPAYNEEQTIKAVLQDFHTQAPDAILVVIDNNSSDNTASIARTTLASFPGSHQLLSEKRQGKANAMRLSFEQINADIYVMVDADCTYAATDLKKITAPVINNEADMVVGDRISTGSYQKENKRPLHNAGNLLVRWLINKLFKAKLRDILSGYRAFNKKFVKNYPILCEGFEIETDMTLHALDKKFRIVELPIEYKDRPLGSSSKLNTVKDGIRVLRTIVTIAKDYKPFFFFGSLSTLFLILAVIVGTPVIMEFIREHYIYKVPSAILASGLVSVSLVLFAVGLILDTVVKFHQFDFRIKVLHNDTGAHT